MSKNNFIEINAYDENEMKEMFRHYFLPSLNDETISIRGKKLCMDVCGKKYGVDLYDFSFVWNPSFDYIFREEFTKYLKVRTVTADFIEKLYKWTNPIFDEFPVKVKEKEKFLEKFFNKLEEDEEYYNVVREKTIEKIESVIIEDRKKYINKYISFGILNQKDKIPLQYYATYSSEELKKLIENNALSEDEKMDVVSQAFVFSRKKEKLKNKKVNHRLINILKLIPIKDIISLFKKGMISVEEFERVDITKQDILNVSYEGLIDFLDNENDRLSPSLKIKSIDLVNEYLRTRNGNEIRKLLNYGYIKPEDLIEIYEINKTLEFIDYNDYIFENEELKKYYTPEILITMKKIDKITPRFLQRYLEMVDFENNVNLFETFSRNLINELLKEKEKNKEDDKTIEEAILEFFEIGLCETNVVREYIKEDYIEKSFMNGNISIDKIFEYYQVGLITDKTIVNYYSPIEILNLYENNEINGKCLNVVKNSNLLMEKFIDGKIADEDFINLYFEGNISVEDLNDSIELYDKEIDIASFIDENVPFSKIKELFLNYVIDYASILRFRNNGIISNDQFEKMKSESNTKEFFKDLKNGKKYKVVTSRKNTVNSGSNSKTYKVQDKEDYSLEIALISELLEKDVENESYSLIESYNAKGKPTSLNNYRIFGNEELDGIVILQKSKKENSVYVMNALQMMYFLKGKENEEGEIEIQNRMKDKAYLKTIEGVEIVDHKEHFAKNLVEAASRVSPKINARIKKADRTYISEVDKMVKDMREKYLETKAKAKEKVRD